VGYIDKSDAKLIFQADQFILHILSEFEIQSAEWFIQKEDVRFFQEKLGQDDLGSLALAHVLKRTGQTD